MTITVRTLLQIILENELKIDDEIDFGLDEDCEINGEYYEINFYNLIFHLNRIRIIIFVMFNFLKFYIHFCML